MNENQRQRVVIVGGGFGGLYAAQAMQHAPVDVTLIDKRNFHLFQPLLYQVATGQLNPADIASPLRTIVRRAKNIKTITAEVTDIDPDNKRVILADGEVAYDTLIIATGASHHYFGRDDEWAALAPGLKTVEDALNIRRRILTAYEAAEREPDPVERQAWLTFVIVGGGPTGVELAGAIAEIAHHTLQGEFRNCDPSLTRILLLEGLDRVLPGYPAELSAAAEAMLERLKVTVRTRALVTEIEPDYVMVRDQDTGEQTLIPARTVLWGAGVKASPLGRVLAERADAELDKAGRVIVQPDLTIPGRPDIFVIGDLAHFAHQGGGPLPGVAQVAMQQGEYVADILRRRRFERSVKPFHYTDKGAMAVIGRNAAVADVGKLHFSGFSAWLLWALIHITFLIEFDNKFKVASQWAWTYFTRRHGSLLITGVDTPAVPSPRRETAAGGEAEMAESEPEAAPARR
jgi:NADH dehydrogenase